MTKNGLKILSMVLILMLMATSLAFAAVPSDVKGEAYEDAVEKLMDRGVITGDTDGLYHPEATLSRAQACAIVVRAIDPPSSELFGTATQSIPDSGFTDMVGHGWAAPYINYAVKNGIALGVGNNKFNPAGKVKSTELVTFVLRAAGYSDESLGGVWPMNYAQKAKELELGAGLGTVVPEYANKWMTAQFTYNALSLIDEAQKEEPVSGAIILTGLTYTIGSFDSNLSTFDGNSLAKNVAVYTYEAKKDYEKNKMPSKNPSDYRSGDVNNYKMVNTPAWYLMSSGKVIQIILPYDVGFTGPIYGLIKSTNSSLNGIGEKVTGLDTWTVMKEMTWLCQKDIVVPVVKAGSGEIYEMYARNGEIRSITTAGFGQGKRFAEIASTSTAAVKVESTDKGIIGITSGTSISYYEVADHPTVYVVQSDDTYKEGSFSNIKKGQHVRMYDISNDKSENIDIIVVDRNR